MKEKINIKLNGKNIKTDKCKIIDLIEDKEKIYICASVNNRIRELNYEIYYDANVELLTLENEEASLIYENSLRYLVAMAFYEINPQINIRLSYHQSRSVQGIILNDNIPLTEELIDKVNNRIDELIKLNLPFERKIIPNEEAKEIYQKFNMLDKIDLLQYRPEKTVHFYVCNNYYNYMYGYMVPSTGYIKNYRLSLYNNSFILQCPRSECDGEIPPFVPSPKFAYTLNKSYEWAKLVNTDTVAKINHHVENSGDVDFINLCEAYHNNLLSDLGRIIKSNIELVRLICIAGPSSSGKTTFSNRLRSELLSRGIKPIRISLDDYYLPREEAPLDEDGKPDLESLEALDVKLFNDHMRKLIDGEKVQIPHFSFKLGKRVEGPTYQIKKDQLIIIEGIHALNEKLTHSIPKSNKYKIYIAPQEQINIDNHNPVSLTNMRLIRRLVRDYKFRNSPPEETLSMWPSVRRGEFKWIYDTQEDADFIFNSLLFYEHCVLKDEAIKILDEVKDDSPYYIHAQRLKKFIKYFIPMDDKWVPCNSLLQEFIGHSCYEKH